MIFRKILSILIVAVGCISCSGGDEPAGLGTKLTAPEEISLSADSPYTLNIRCSAAPTLTSDADWLHVAAASLVEGTSNIYRSEVRADINPTAEVRMARITVVSGSESAVVNVSQYAGDVVEIMSIEPQGNLNPAGGTLKVTYKATAPVSVTAPEWMTVADDPAASVVTMTYLANTGDAPRSAEVVLAVSETAKASFTVSQDKTEQLSGRAAKQIVADMYAGINIGNTLEAPGSETGWVKTLVNADYIRGLKQLGFNAVRVPCAWDSHVVDKDADIIDPAWLDRIDEVVGYIVGNGMYAVVNSHWDGGWMDESFKDGYSDEVNRKQRNYWKQIAEKLNHYDQHLLFASMNEPDCKNNDGIGFMLRYNQTMVDAVRATGGNNTDRVIVIQGPRADIDATVEGHFTMPEDNVADRLAVEVHFYSPYQFNMMEKDENWGKMHYYWGKNNLLEGSDRNSSDNEGYVAAQMQKMKNAFTDKGIPGILGEFAVCANRDGYADIDKDRWRASVRDWNYTVASEAKKAGLAPFFWEISEDINRVDGTLRRSFIINGVMDGASAANYPF